MYIFEINCLKLVIKNVYIGENNAIKRRKHRLFIFLTKQWTNRKKGI